MSRPVQRRDSLAADMDRVARRVLALVVLVLATAAAGLWYSEVLRQDVLTHRRPAVTANGALMVDLLQAQSGMRAYVATGDERFLTSTTPDRERIRARQQRIVALAGEDQLTREQDAAIDRWWAFRDAVVAERRAGRDAARRLPATPFGQLQAANQALDAELSARVKRSTQRTTWVLGATGALHVLEVSLLGLLVARLRRRLLGDVLRPLDELRDTVADPDPTRRVATCHGPAEVRELARVVNDHRDQVTRSEQESAATLRRMEALDRQKTNFMATVSHELRTPLTSISGYLEMLTDGDYGELTTRQTQAVEVVDRNTQRLRQLIEDLLVLSRIEASGVELQPRPVQLVDLARRVVENLQPQATRGEVELGLAPGDALPAVSGDPDQLERALTNVIGNAVKFTPAGGRVQVELGRHDDCQQVKVVDTGIGIPAADLSDVGRRFFRAGNVTDQTIPGTGLGLSIVNAIMESHGGSCRVESEVGRGTTVTLSLPSTQPTEGEAPELAS